MSEVSSEVSYSSRFDADSSEEVSVSEPRIRKIGVVNQIVTVVDRFVTGVSTEAVDLERKVDKSVDKQKVVTERDDDRDVVTERDDDRDVLSYRQEIYDLSASLKIRSLPEDSKEMAELHYKVTFHVKLA